jgi:predicted nucleic-acid-binding Zn-ribbon protein
MTTVLAIQPAMPARPTPVPIAAARPRKQQKLSPGKENFVAGKPTSTNGPVSNIRSRRERPCDACRRRKSRCVIHEGAALCVLCEFHKQECTFVQSPLPRKRKVVDGDKKDSPNVSKKRCVYTFHYCASTSQDSGTTITYNVFRLNVVSRVHVKPFPV